jgi:hypothetical protein
MWISRAGYYKIFRKLRQLEGLKAIGGRGRPAVAHANGIETLAT